jgi:peptidyl-dipeptidase Dcp
MKKSTLGMVMLLAAALLLAPSAPPRAQTRITPLTAPSTLPFQAPPFNKLTDADYQPAIEEGMRQQLAEIAAIANSAAAATFDNTVVAMEKSGQMLDRAQAAFSTVVGANSNDKLIAIQSALAPKLAAHADAIFLNAKLFARIKTLYEQRANLKLDSESARVLDIIYQQFVHAGANLPEKGKAELRDMNKQIASLSADFRKKLLAGTKAGALIVDNKAALAGLSAADIDAAAKAAADRGLKGKYAILLQNTTQQPALTDLANRDTREKLFNSRWTATEKGDANDTRAIISQLAVLRARKAALFGYSNYAAYALYDQMVTTPDKIEKFLGQLSPAAGKKSEDEAKEIQDAINKSGGRFDLKPWDWQRYSEMVRKAKYDLDDNALKPYFELNTVLEKGVFYAATRLYGITFKRRTDLPVYHPDVRVYEVTDNNGASLGLVYLDFFKRDNKEGGAWMDSLVPQSRLLNRKPVVINVLNIPKPAPGQPVLISYDNVNTMFHEFGHALHYLFADHRFERLHGSIARDFVEYPSQFNENWALHPEVLKNYALHYKTGAPIPQALVDKIKKSQTWNQGYELAELLAASELDMQWHMLPASAPKQDVDAFETKALKASHTDFKFVPPRYRSSYFLHIWANGYAGAYYAYQWTVMLADDTYAWFTSHGGLTRANGQRYRDMILSKGRDGDYATLFRAFYGKDPDVGPMLVHRGLPPQ